MVGDAMQGPWIGRRSWKVPRSRAPGRQLSDELFGVDLGLLRGAVARAGDGRLVDEGIQVSDDIALEHDVLGLQVFPHMVDETGTRDRHDEVALAAGPGQCQLGRGAAGGLGDALICGQQRQVFA